LDVPEVAPLLATLLSLPSADRYPPLALTPQRQKEKTLEAVLELLRAMAAQRPLLLVIEDLQWADPSTLELLDRLIARVPAAAICVLLTCRPDFQPPWPADAHLTHIALNRLTQADVARMVERVTGGKALPPEVLGQVVDKTDGIP